MKSTFAAIILSCCSAIPAEDRPPFPPETVAQLVRDLDAAEFSVRQAATRRLAEGGAEVVDSLKVVVAEGSLERRYRALDVLGKIYSRGNPDSFNAIEGVLEQISLSPNTSLAVTAQNLIDANYETRQQLAVAEIQKLGGKILRNPVREPVLIGDADPDAEPRREVVTAIVLDQQWKGGDEGLKHVKRLTRLAALYRVKAAKISDGAIEELRQALPTLDIQSRGEAYFGITGSVVGEHCRISTVSPGGPAAKAGLQPEDVILQFDGHEVKGFTQLIELIATKSPHDKVTVAIERNGQTMDVTVELLPWPGPK